MSKLFDMNRIDEIFNNLKKINSPEDLQGVIQNSKDIIDSYVVELKGIPDELQRWGDTLKDLGIYTGNTDFPRMAEELFFNNAKNGVGNALLNSNKALKDSLTNSNLEDNLNGSILSINGIKIDFIDNVKGSYSTSVYSQPIISEKTLTRLTEHAENENPIIKLKCCLTGVDRQQRFDNINNIRENKIICSMIANKNYERLIITEINVTYENNDVIEFSIEFENVFIAQLKRSESKRVEPKKNSTSLKNPVQDLSPRISNMKKVEAIEKEQVPIWSMNSFVRDPKETGIQSSIKWAKERPAGIYAN